MKFIQTHENLIKGIVRNYLQRFPMYQVLDFQQDIFLKLLEKETRIQQKYKENMQGLVSFENYLARVVWNECKNLGQRKYDKQYQINKQILDIQEYNTSKMPYENSSLEEDTAYQTFKSRIEKALKHQKMQKQQQKISLYINLKNKEEISVTEIQQVFPEANQEVIQDCLAEIQKAKNDKHFYRILAKLSGKKPETEQRWFNEQIHRIRDIIQN